MLIILVVVSACRKSDNATMLDGILYVNQPQITKIVDGYDLAISFQEPLSFKGKIKTDLYFNNNTKPKYIDLIVVKNDDVKTPKVLRQEITTFPFELEITGQQIVDLFGAIELGDNYDIGANYITEDGKTLEAFPKNGALGYGAGVKGQPGTSVFVRYSCICAFDMDDFVGDGKFAVVEDAWADYQPGQEVIITKVSETQIKFSAPDEGFKDYVIDINPLDNSAKMSSQVVATDGSFWYGVDVGSVTLSTGGDASASFVDPCSKELSLNVQFLLSKYGNQGSYLLKVKKK